MTYALAFSSRWISLPAMQPCGPIAKAMCGGLVAIVDLCHSGTDVDGVATITLSSLAILTVEPCRYIVIPKDLSSDDKKIDRVDDGERISS